MIATYDIETIGKEIPIAVGFFDGDKYKSFLKVSEDTDPIWLFLSYVKEEYAGCRLFAHNAVNFDNKFILDCLVRHGEKVSFPAGTAKIRWDEYLIDFEDSYLMLGISLRKACKAFKLEEKGVWDHGSTRPIWDMSELKEFLLYLERDCKALYEVIEEYCRLLLKEFNLLPSMTMALTSVKIFDKCFYPIKNVNSNLDFEHFVRLATFGARNEVYTRKADSFYLYDINFMYVSCYDVDIPIGPMKWTKPDIDRPSLANAVVKIPDMYIGPLPFRYNDSLIKSRLLFPVGEIEGWWDIYDLRFAVSQGCDIKIIRQLECDEAPILSKFGQQIWDLRKLANPELSKVWKLLGVRLAGKLGQHRIRTEVSHIKDIKDQTGWWPLDETEIYHERLVSSQGKRAPYIKPAVNMRIRSAARARHGKQIYEASKKGLVHYCDNDSIYTNVSMKTGLGLGDLKMIDHATRGWFVRPKFYGYEDDKGHLRRKMSGFHEFNLTSYDFECLTNGGEVEFRQVLSTLTPWKKVLTGVGIENVSLSRSVKANKDFENRRLIGKETEPIKLYRENGRIKKVEEPFYSVPTSL